MTVQASGDFKYLSRSPGNKQEFRDRIFEMKHWTMAEIKKANAEAGRFWFSLDTLRFFGCRLGKTVYQGKGGVFFVSSKKNREYPRYYTIRQFNPRTGRISTAEGCPSHEWPANKARRVAARMAEGTLA